MPIITVGIYCEPSKTIIINKPFDYIKTIDIREKINGKRIIGWCVDQDKLVIR